jgi:hypothetical protein
MPYIRDKNRRLELDQIVEAMEQLDVNWGGDLNYILFKFFVYNVPKEYNQIKAYKGELNECKDEIQRRFMGPREIEAIEENGDV